MAVKGSEVVAAGHVNGEVAESRLVTELPSPKFHSYAARAALRPVVVLPGYWIPEASNETVVPSGTVSVELPAVAVLPPPLIANEPDGPGQASVAFGASSISSRPPSSFPAPLLPVMSVPSSDVSWPLVRTQTAPFEPAASDGLLGAFAVALAWSVMLQALAPVVAPDVLMVGLPSVSNNVSSGGADSLSSPLPSGWSSRTPGSS